MSLGYKKTNFDQQHQMLAVGLPIIKYDRFSRFGGFPHNVGRHIQTPMGMGQLNWLRHSVGGLGDRSTNPVTATFPHCV